MPTCFLDSRDGAIATKIRQIFCEAEEICCIVAFWGAGALDLFCDVPEKRKKKTRIVCNLTMGGTNPRIIEELIEAGFRVKHNPHLHSKVYWTNKGVVAGSANASANGLSLEGVDQDGWLEAAFFSNRPSDIVAVKRYVQKIWSTSEQVTALDLKKAQKRWSSRRPFLFPCPDMTFVDALKQGRFSDRQQRIYVSISVEDFSEEEHRYIEGQAGELQETFIELQGRAVSAWMDWTDIPREEYVVDFFRGPRGGIRFDGTWRTLPAHCDHEAPSGETYQFAYRVEEGEIGMTAPQRRQMTDTIRCIVNRHPIELSEDLYECGCCIGMDHLMKLANSGVTEECF